jgi:hypothetical protein
VFDLFYTFLFFIESVESFKGFWSPVGAIAVLPALLVHLFYLFFQEVQRCMLPFVGHHTYIRAWIYRHPMYICRLLKH